MYKNIYIIKSGESETWIKDDFDTVSYGDVLRTTTILNFLISDSITWFGYPKTFPIIPSLPNLVKCDIALLNIEKILTEKNSLVINLEKVEYLKNVKFQIFENFIGFYFDKNKNEWLISNFKKDIFNLNSWNKHCQDHNAITWGSKLNLLFGYHQKNSLGIVIQNKASEKYDFGLNWQVGSKWPSKQIPENKWKELESHLKKNHSVSWQEGFNSLEQYIAWIQSCRVIISTDSLGLHLSMAMNKPTIGLFGATSSFDVDKNASSVFINLEMPKEYQCRPCFSPLCQQKIHCSDFIDFELIKENAIRLLNAK